MCARYLRVSSGPIDPIAVANGRAERGTEFAGHEVMQKSPRAEDFEFNQGSDQTSHSGLIRQCCECRNWSMPFLLLLCLSFAVSTGCDTSSRVPAGRSDAGAARIEESHQPPAVGSRGGALTSERPVAIADRRFLEYQTVEDYHVRFMDGNGPRADRLLHKDSFRRCDDLSGQYGKLGPDEAQLRWLPPGIVSTGRVARGNGFWHSLAGQADDKQCVLNFEACYPACISAKFQPRCVGAEIEVRGRGRLRLAVKSPADDFLCERFFEIDSPRFEKCRCLWEPSGLANCKFLNWDALAGELEIDRVDLLISMPEIPIDASTFLKSYAKLARCYSPRRGIVKDRADRRFGEMDSVPATGLFVLATCAAADVGLVDRQFARATMLRVHEVVSRVPSPRGLLPHFLRQPAELADIEPASEFSTIDTAIYYHSMLLAAQMLGDRSLVHELSELIGAIAFKSLSDEAGRISHGLQEDGKTVLPDLWYDWGGETALVLLLQQMAEGAQGRLVMSHSGRVFNDIGFIAEIAPLFFPQFNSDVPDAVSGQNWRQARIELLQRQKEHVQSELAGSAAARLGLYSMSTGESGDGGAYDESGNAGPGRDHLHPHYMLMSACLYDDPADAYALIHKLESKRLFPPWGLVESFSADLRIYLPINSALNAAFEAISSYHLFCKNRGRRDEIYRAAERCPVTARALRAFYPDRELSP
jgi:hypothetical protein